MGVVLRSASGPSLDISNRTTQPHNMPRYSSLLSLLLIIVFSQIGDCLRCYQCRSDEQPDCGDPFLSSRVPSAECDNFYTQRTFTCFKVSTNAAGRYITVRGCAPFTTDIFPGAMQRGVAGTYWKGFNAMSLCDFNNCNSAISIKSPAFLTVLILNLSLFWLRKL